MIPVALNDEGPDMDAVEKLVAEDESIRGMWCVPRYSNPSGVTYSDVVVDRLAKMKTAARDFRILWDNAYNVHHLYDTPDPLKNVLTACKEAGNPDRVIMFGSTSKITFAGAGISAISASAANIADIKSHLSKETIGPDKLNQLRHLSFIKDMEGLDAHMVKHADILRPKFEKVHAILSKHFADSDHATWGKPRGGYFISLDTRPGKAKRVVQLADEAGVKLTPAGATYPYGNDPEDRNIRIAPSFPSLDELEQATEILCLCIKLASAE
jgi:DNA-binding transcriptional MocR family regulator